MPALGNGSFCFYLLSLIVGICKVWLSLCHACFNVLLLMLHLFFYRVFLFLFDFALNFFCNLFYRWSQKGFLLYLSFVVFNTSFSYGCFLIYLYCGFFTSSHVLSFVFHWSPLSYAFSIKIDLLSFLHCQV